MIKRLVLNHLERLNSCLCRVEFAQVTPPDQSLFFIILNPGVRLVATVMDCPLTVLTTTARR
jgi:hypothetical protein